MAEPRSPLSTKRSGKVVKIMNDDEQTALEKALATFTFDSDVTAATQPKTLLLWGDASTGKSHLYSTLKSVMPVYVMDTEGRYAVVAEKFGIKTWKRVSSFEECFVFVRHIIKNNLPKGVVVFDSSTDLRIYAEQRTLVETDKDVIGKARNWGSVWDKLDWFVDTLREAGHWVVFTARESDVYRDEKQTGEVKPSTYNRVTYWSDLTIHLKKDGTREIQKPLPHQIGSQFVPTYDMSLIDIMKGAGILDPNFRG